MSGADLAIEGSMARVTPGVAEVVSYIILEL